MSGMAFTPATKLAAKARIAFAGPAGSGKTYSALRVGSAMGQRIALIDTEHGSASKYADRFTFDTLTLTDFHPNTYIAAIRAAEAAGYDVLIIDSITHEWNGQNGCLELVDLEARKSKTRDTHAAWAKVTPLHTAFIEAILGANLHVIATMRSKMDYIRTEDERGKTKIQKVGMAPITRDSTEYEFDILGDIDLSHDCVITKTRCDALADRVFHRPGEDMAQVVLEWLSGNPAALIPPHTTQPGQPATGSQSMPGKGDMKSEPESEPPPGPAPSESNSVHSSIPNDPTDLPTPSDKPNRDEALRRSRELTEYAKALGYTITDLRRLFLCVSNGRDHKQRTLHDLHNMNTLLAAMLRCSPPFEPKQVLEMIEITLPQSERWSAPEYDYVMAMLATTIQGKEASHVS